MTKIIEDFFEEEVVEEQFLKKLAFNMIDDLKVIETNEILLCGIGKVGNIIISNASIIIIH